MVGNGKFELNLKNLVKEKKIKNVKFIDFKDQYEIVTFSNIHKYRFALEFG